MEFVHALFSLMWSMAQALWLDLAPLTRAQINNKTLPSITVKEAVEAGHLPPARGQAISFRFQAVFESLPMKKRRFTRWGNAKSFFNLTRLAETVKVSIKKMAAEKPSHTQKA